ncbi:alpha/beta fold hydrolase [Thiobacter aerophilum]|uniref:Alpha/beta fold hydrolase n=1 Tax=Thiobacter aerophilum TaxID=3121275 RepID=A0ABV0ECR1_9BURK
MSRYCLHLRDSAVGGPVVSGRLYRFVNGVEVDWDAQLPEFTASTRGQRLLVLLHGYNVSRSEGRASLARYMDLLAAQGLSDPMLAVLWPGDGWAKALSYPFEGRDADDSAEVLWKWLSTHLKPGTRVAFAGHSLGCRVAMATARRLALAGTLRLDRIVLMAPAIDNDSLGQSGRFGYREGTLGAERVAVLASEQDWVLRFAYPLGDLTQTILFGERWGRALGLSGPVERDPEVLARLEPVPRADPAYHVDHGDYLGVARQGGHTVAETERFLAPFLERHSQPRWPAAG